MLLPVPPSIENEDLEGAVKVPEGQTAHLTCNATGKGTPVAGWEGAGEAAEKGGGAGDLAARPAAPRLHSSSHLGLGAMCLLSSALASTSAPDALPHFSPTYRSRLPAPSTRSPWLTPWAWSMTSTGPLQAPVLSHSSTEHTGPCDICVSQAGLGLLEDPRAALSPWFPQCRHSRLPLMHVGWDRWVDGMDGWTD